MALRATYFLTVIYGDPVSTNLRQPGVWTAGAVSRLAGLFPAPGVASWPGPRPALHDRPGLRHHHLELRPPPGRGGDNIVATSDTLSSGVYIKSSLQCVPESVLGVLVAASAVVGGIGIISIYL